jgi:hypothetical protein
MRDDVAAVIRNASLCWRCIAHKAGLTADQVDEALITLGRAVEIALALAACEGCERDTLVYGLSDS